MATITVKYQLSGAYRENVLTETGERLLEKQELLIELTELSKEQRGILVDLAGLAESVDVSDHNSPGTWASNKFVRFDAPLTLESAIKAAQAKIDALAKREAEQREAKAESEREWRERMAKDAQEKMKARQRQEEAEQKKAQAKADKLAWCETHGSDHLRTAVENGYDCTRLYATERAAVEYPGYTLDFDNAAEWKSRSCPSPAALAEALRVNGEVVWLTAQTKNQDHNDEYDYWDEFEPCEAVTVRYFLGKYDLVRTF